MTQKIESDVYYNQGTITDTDWKEVKKSLGSTHKKYNKTQNTGKMIVRRRIRTRFSDSTQEITEYKKHIKYHNEIQIYFEGALEWEYGVIDEDGNEDWYVKGKGSLDSKQLYNIVNLVYNYTEVKDQLGYVTYYYSDSSGSIIKTVKPEYTDDKGNKYQEIAENNYVYNYTTKTTNHHIQITEERWYRIYYKHTDKEMEVLITHPTRKERSYHLGEYYIVIEKRTTSVPVSVQKTVHNYSYLFQPISVANKIKINGTEYLINKTTYTFDNNFNITKESNSIDSHTKHSKYYYTEDEFIINRVTEKWEYNKSNGEKLLIKVKLFYDDYGNLTEIQKNINGEMKTLTRYEYDDNYPGNLIKIIDANGNITEYEYSEKYRNAYPTKITKYLDGAPIHSYYEYDFYTGNITALIDYLGNRIEYKYDKLNRLIYTKNPDGSIKEVNYSTSLQRSEIILKNKYGKILQKKIKYYGDLGHLLTETIEDGQNSKIYNKTQYIYNKRAELIKKIQDPENKKITTEYLYDSAGRLRQILFPDGGKKEYTYYYDIANKNRIVEEISYPTDKEEDKQTIKKYYNFKGELIKIEYPYSLKQNTNMTS